MAKDKDKDNAEPGDFQPTLTDTLYSSLKLPEAEGRVLATLVLLEEVINVLVKNHAIGNEELGGILDRVGERLREGWENTRRETYKTAKERGYPQSYIDEIIDRFTKSAEEALSGIRKRIINDPDQ